jgi:glucose/arabinose dehydrogenase
MLSLKIPGILFTCLLLQLAEPSLAAPRFPEGFVDRPLATGLTSPTAMALSADGKIFVAQENGDIFLIKDEVLQGLVLSIPVDSNYERGLLGIAIDPHFTDQGWLYAYYTVAGDSIHSRLSRFWVSGGKADPAGERVLVDFPRSVAVWHLGGGLGFGPDGMLYLGQGDYLASAESQRLGSVFGKILRINPDSSAPSDNPFSQQRDIWAYGFREPFSLAIQKRTGRIFSNDVGAGYWEEVNEVVRGGNYGWPEEEGPRAAAGRMPPLFSYSHEEIFNSDRCSAVMGGDFYDPKVLRFPLEYAGDYFFADLCQGWIRRVNPATGAMREFASGLAIPTGLKFDADGNMYYTTRGIREEIYPGSIGQGSVHKVTFTREQAPEIAGQPLDIEAAQGKAAVFHVDAAGTPPLNYKWTRNGSTIAGAHSADYTLPRVSAADENALFEVTVTNALGAVVSRKARLSVAGLRPVCVITQPDLATLFVPGQDIPYAATCVQSGSSPLPSHNYSWTVERRKETYVSTFAEAKNGVTTGSFRTPSAEPDSGAWYRIVLTATADNGAVSVFQRDVFPAARGVWQRYVSDLPWKAATNGWGPAERDASNGGDAPADGRPLAIRGRVYPKGLGVHAFSRVSVPLEGNCFYFLGDVGVDDTEKEGGTAEFEVWTDRRLAYRSGPLTSALAAHAVEAPLYGSQSLHLIAHNGGGPVQTGVADWGGARVICQKAALTGIRASSAAPRAADIFRVDYRGGALGEIGLACDLPAAGRVKIEIRDQSGRLLATPVDGLRPAGAFKASWGAPGLHGLVFAVLKTDAGSWVRKVLAVP